MATLSSEEVSKIKKLMRATKEACTIAQVPFISVFQYDEAKPDGTVKTVLSAETLSPATVGCENGHDIFYSLQNLASGKYITIPAERKDGE